MTPAEALARARDHLPTGPQQALHRAEHEHAERRWLAITLLLSLDVVVPLRAFLGWSREARALPVVVGRDALMARRAAAQAASAPPDGRDLLLSRLADAALGDELVEWERRAFVDLHVDDPHWATWLDFFRTAAHEPSLWPERLGPKPRQALEAFIAELDEGPLVPLIATLRAEVLSRMDALLYARYQLDHDDVACDDPFRRVRYHHDVAAARRFGAELARHLSESGRRDLTVAARRWAQESRWLPSPLRSLDDLGPDRVVTP